jgi:serine/threonine protein phosphatase PrpC
MASNEWKVAGTFVTGLDHERQNNICHDSFSYKISNSVISMSIADGAGSAKYPEIGAKIASIQVNNTLTKDFDWLFHSDENNTVHKITHAIRTIIGIHAKKQNASIQDFATTLIFVSVKEDKFIAGHIGDGILACLLDNDLKIISYPENGEFINETYFITTKSYKSRFRIYKGLIGDIKGFVLMTDGTCESLFDKQNKSMAPIVFTLFDWLDNYPIEIVNKALKENFENVVKRKTTDDCSIGLLKLTNHKIRTT